MPDVYLIPAELLQATVDYLAKRPYAEVAGAIGALSSLERATPTQPPQETKIEEGSGPK
jgi:hypothetical protein